MPLDRVEYLGLDVWPDRILSRVGGRLSVDGTGRTQRTALAGGERRARVADTGLADHLGRSDWRGKLAVADRRTRADH